MHVAVCKHTHTHSLSFSLSHTQHIHLLSPNTQAPLYWRHPLRPLLSSRQLVSYIILDIEPLDGPSGGPSYGTPSSGSHSRFLLAEATVAKATDFGVNDRTFYTRTHLGHVLHPGDMALGYDLSTANFVDDEMEKQLGKVGMGGWGWVALMVVGCIDVGGGMYLFWVVGCMYWVALRVCVVLGMWLVHCMRVLLCVCKGG